VLYVRPKQRALAKAEESQLRSVLNAAKGA